MTIRTWELRVTAPIQTVWDFHKSARALEVLTPPARRLVATTAHDEVRAGDVHILRFRLAGIPVEWHARIIEANPPHGFTDLADKSPFAYWQHRHEFIEDGDGTIIRDTLTYLPPLGVLGGIADWLVIGRMLDKMWRHRHEATKRQLQPGSAGPLGPARGRLGR